MPNSVYASPNAKKIEKDLKWFEHDVKQFVQAVKYGMIGSELWELQELCIKNEKNLKKYENEMTPEQKAKFKKYQKMLNKYKNSRGCVKILNDTAP